MSHNIAVILNDSDQLTTFEKGVVLKVFSKNDNRWRIIDEINYSLDLASNISNIRNNIKTVLLQLNNCKVIIGEKVAGLPYNILESLGFEIYEAQEVSDSLLDEIITELEAESAHSNDLSSEVPTSPVETSEHGVFFLNLIKLQEKHPEISSKKALKSFIETHCFRRLDVICSHIPPWFDTVLPQKRLSYKIDELERNQIKVSIIKKVC